MIKLEQVNKTDNARRQIEGDRGNVLKSKKKDTWDSNKYWR